ncbi:Mdm33 family-domain-containing protein [Hypomontagnella monticulosa]|nr:Mdm33 family-domain-containing protein [Hypomontagnella monticulosa]
MSTPRAFKPIFGPSRRFLLDQLVPQSTARCAPGKLISRGLPTPVCPSCRHSFALTLNRQLRFSSSKSTPPNPPRNLDSENRPNESEPPSPFPFPPPPNDPEPQRQEDPKPESELKSASPLEDTKPHKNPDLPSAQNSRRSSLNQSLSAFMDRAQTTLFAASQRINDLTGYSGIETLKSQVSALESSLAAAQSQLHQARSSYKHAVSSRSATQREVTTLLARQKTWTPADFERFTALYRQDYELEALVSQRATELEEAERAAEQLGRELSAGILARYHEEQIWSDKIRRMSTWGTWGLMGVNVLMFLIFQFGAEPWRRRRLVRGFEEKVREALEEERILREAEEAERKRIEGEYTAAATANTASAPVVAEAVDREEVKTNLSTEAPVEEAIVEGPPQIPWRETLSNPDRWKAVFADLSSDKKVAIRMRDVSIIALESAAAGAAVVGTIATILFIRRG